MDEETEHSPHQSGGSPVNFTENLTTTWAPRVHSILRIVAAYLFLLHGSAKLLHVPHITRFDEVQILSLSGVAGVLELVGGTLLILGLFTRPVAFILSGEMAFAYFIGHATKDTVFLPLMNGGEPAVLFCFIFLFLAVAGGGTWSVDAMKAQK
jgi:putative oxidoreductase